MIIEYSIQDVLDLSHAACKNFYSEQKDRFEIHKESKRVSFSLGCSFQECPSEIQVKLLPTSRLSVDYASTHAN